MIKKIFESEYPDDYLFEKIEKWVKEKVYYDDGSVKAYSPKIMVEIFNQEGEQLENHDVFKEKLIKRIGFDIDYPDRLLSNNSERRAYEEGINYVIDLIKKYEK